MGTGMVQIKTCLANEFHAFPCGSWLASDGGVSADDNVECEIASLASQLPQVSSVFFRTRTGS
ncbi:hypothetical protein EMIT093MI4_60232 [Pseudomonas sp. IT-93MI4]